MFSKVARASIDYGYNVDALQAAREGELKEEGGRERVEGRSCPERKEIVRSTRSMTYVSMRP